MSKSVKVAISIPDKEFGELEDLRMSMGISRSQLLLRTLRFWKEAREKEQMVASYIEGYKKVPEDTREQAAWEKASMTSVSAGEW